MMLVVATPRNANSCGREGEAGGGNMMGGRCEQHRGSGGGRLHLAVMSRRSAGQNAPSENAAVIHVPFAQL